MHQDSEELPPCGDTDVRPQEPADLPPPAALCLALAVLCLLLWSAAHLAGWTRAFGSV